MKKAERFLAVLALVAWLITVSDRRAGLPVALIAFPLLALFYAVCGYFLFSGSGSNRTKASVVLSLFTGGMLATGIFFLRAYLFGWLPPYFLLLLGFLPQFVAGILALFFQRQLYPGYMKAVLLRMVPLSLIICISACLPLFGHGAVK